VANQYDTAKPLKAQKRDQKDGTRLVDGAYILEDPNAYVRELRRKHKIDDKFKDSVLPHFKMPENPRIPRLKKISVQESYLNDFLDNKKFNMSIIDLNGDSKEDHNTMAAYLENSLYDSKPREEHKVWIVHLSCYAEPMRITPLALSIILREGILKKIGMVPSKENEDWGPIRLDPKKSRRKTGYETIMELVRRLIRQVLKMFPGNTLHFVFSGLRLGKLQDEQRLSLIRFMIDMAQLGRDVVDPIKDERTVKCIFCGTGLPGSLSLLKYLAQDKEQLMQGGSSKGDIIVDSICNQTLMLKWENDEWCQMS
jgi:hypothetical protein